MNSRFDIGLSTNGRGVTEEDRDRARDAAVAVLVAAGVEAAYAYEDYLTQMEQYGEHEGMTGPAAVWVEAERAADRALTQGWADPQGAYCSIHA